MRVFVCFYVLLFGMAACGPFKGPKGADGSNGTDGRNGLGGSNGASGSNGHSVVYSTLAVAPGCPAGGKTILIALDVNDSLSFDVGDANVQSTEICNGVNGTDGSNGQDGQDGVNGRDGRDGQDGLTPTIPPFQPTEIVSFCGDYTRSWSEVGFRLSNGMIVASFSDNAAGQNTRLTVIVPGSYRTTDGYSCNFTVTASGQIVR